MFSGADWNEVTAVPGEPWDVGSMSRNRAWPRLFAYGDLELSVCRCKMADRWSNRSTIAVTDVDRSQAFFAGGQGMGSCDE